MKLMIKALFAAIAVVVLWAGPVHAQSVSPESVVGELEIALMAFVPVLVFITSLVLKPGAADRVKRTAPAVVGVVVAVAYFVATTWPGFGVELIGNIIVFISVGMKFYEPMTGAVQILTDRLGLGERGINEVTGPGFVGSDDDVWVEGD